MNSTQYHIHWDLAILKAREADELDDTIMKHDEEKFYHIVAKHADKEMLHHVVATNHEGSRWDRRWAEICETELAEREILGI